MKDVTKQQTRIPRKKSIIHAACICLCSILVSYGIFQLDFFKGLELKAGDFLERLTPSKGKSPQISVIAIDETTLNTLSWPITRDYYISLIHILNEYNAHSIVFDIAFIDENKDHQQWDTLLALTTSDASLQSKVIHSFYFNISEWKKPETDDQTIKRFSLPAPPEKIFTKALSADRPFPFLLENAEYLGHFHLTPDKDGIYRRLPLFIEFNNRIYPGISLLAANNLFDNVQPVIQKNAILLKNERQHVTIPVDKNGNTRILFNGNGEEFETISLLELLHNYKTAVKIVNRSKLLDRVISGKVVLIGNTAAALGDYGAIPTNNNIPKVYIHASAISTVINGKFIHDLPGIITIAVIILLLFLTALSCLTQRAIKTAAIWILLTIAYCSIAFIMHLNLFTMPLGLPVLSMILCYMCLAVYTRFYKERQIYALETAVGKYVSLKILEKINMGEKNLMQEKQEREITILFSDIRGFTKLCSTIDKEVLYPMLTEYLDAMSGIILNNRGVVDKYMGDGIMAYFDSEESPDHANMAVTAALEMQEQVYALNKKWHTAKRPEIKIRIGINTGMVFIGDMGTEHFSDYTLFGNEVNIAQRMESAAEAGTIYVSKSTYEKTKDDFDYMYKDKISLKNVPSPMDTYKVMSKKKLFKGI